MSYEAGAFTQETLTGQFPITPSFFYYYGWQPEEPAKVELLQGIFPDMTILADFGLVV